MLVNDSFCAYIALHFLAAQERQQQEAKVVRIVYVCSTGLGVTSLIEQKILEEVPNVELAGFASVLNATEEIPCNREVSHERQEEIRQIECLFAKNELPVNHAEISALLNYLEQPKEEEDGTSNGSTGDHSTKC